MAPKPKHLTKAKTPSNKGKMAANSDTPKNKTSKPVPAPRSSSSRRSASTKDLQASNSQKDGSSKNRQPESPHMDSQVFDSEETIHPTRGFEIGDNTVQDAWPDEDTDTQRRSKTKLKRKRKSAKEESPLEESTTEEEESTTEEEDLEDLEDSDAGSLVDDEELSQAVLRVPCGKQDVELDQPLRRGQHAVAHNQYYQGPAHPMLQEQPALAFSQAPTPMFGPPPPPMLIGPAVETEMDFKPMLHDIKYFCLTQATLDFPGFKSVLREGCWKILSFHWNEKVSVLKHSLNNQLPIGMLKHVHKKLGTFRSAILNKFYDHMLLEDPYHLGKDPTTAGPKARELIGRTL
ncbi:hypothetical protein HDU98_003606, partial [Podochytrium sp. JEL0797]